MYRTLQTSLRGLRRNILRSTLTCLGIIIGIAAVIAMAEIGQGAAGTYSQILARMGANIIQVDPSDTVKAGVSSGSGGRVDLTPDDAQAIQHECAYIKWIAPGVDCRMQVVAGNRNYSPRNILGTSPDYFLIRNWGVDAGAHFTDDDVLRSAGVCLLGHVVVDALFKNENPIGKEVRVNNVRMKVVGILSRKGASLYGSDLDDTVIAPWTTVKFRISSSRSKANPGSSSINSPVNSLSDLYPSKSLSLYPSKSANQLANYPMLSRFMDLDDIYMTIDARENLEAAKAQITSILRQRHHLADEDEDDFRIRDWTEISTTMSESTALISKLLLIVALISLVVGGVGIMNIMLVSVTERTREIGLRMAVGARAAHILWQFLFEAALLCTTGGIIGVALGRTASLSISHFLGWPTKTSLPAILAAVIVSVTIGLIFGFYPAHKASRLDPIDALRHE